MIETSLKYKIRNEDIRRRTRVTDVIERMAKFKWHRVGHIGRQDRERWTIKITIWRSRETKRQDSGTMA